MDLENALRSTILGRPEDTTVDVEEFFHPTYTQVTDGVASNYNEFVEHIAHLRGLIASGEVTVMEMVQEGRRVADRHTITIEKRDGSTTSFEVLLIGELADDGRLLRVVETTRQLTGDAADAALGSARS